MWGIAQLHMRIISEADLTLNAVNLRLHFGTAGVQSPLFWQILLLDPTNLKPVLQVYLAMDLGRVLVNLTRPLETPSGRPQPRAMCAFVDKNVDGKILCMQSCLGGYCNSFITQLFM